MKNSPELVAEYFKKSFFSVDGLWFLKVEEASSFDRALDLDAEVWKVLPKIQARTIQKLLEIDNNLDALQAAFSFKLEAEDFNFKIIRSTAHGFTIEIHDCPWVHHIEKAGRSHLIQKIADTICPVEFETFAATIIKNISFKIIRKACVKNHHCIMDFQTTPPADE